MTQAQPGLAEMNARMQQWMNEKPQGNFGNSTELKLWQNDLVIFQFASSGQDGDRLIKAYRSHVFGQQSPRGKRFNEYRYCMVQNGEGQSCTWCEAIAGGQISAETGQIKERMSMWVLVHQILHAQLPQLQQGQQAPNWPIVQYEGANYYLEEVNAWKVWHDSAWRESPWSDICRNASLYNGLHNFTAQMLCTGQGTSKRYKFYVLPNSAPLPQEYYVQAWESLQPLTEMLHAEAVRNISQNPQPTRAVFSRDNPIGNNYVPGGLVPGGLPAPVAVFTPLAAPAPPLAVPMAAPPPLAVAPPQAPATFQPGGNPGTAGVPSGNVSPPPTAVATAPEPVAAPAPAPVQAVAAPVAPPAPVAAPAPPVAPPAIPQAAPALPATPPPPASPTNVVQQAPEDGRRPMRRMF